MKLSGVSIFGEYAKKKLSVKCRTRSGFRAGILRSLITINRIAPIQAQ